MKKNVRLIYDGSLGKIKTAVNHANSILNDPEFYNQIRNYKKFEDTVLSSYYVAHVLEESSLEISVVTTPLFSSKITAADSPNQITINRWDFNTSLSKRVNTLIHHTVNAVAMVNKNIKSNNNTHLEAAPNVIAGIAAVMAKQTKLKAGLSSR
jgi:hypothetical protein